MEDRGLMKQFPSSIFHPPSSILHPPSSILHPVNMSLDRTRHVLNLGLKSISAHRLRSTLTALGIILGVGSVIVMLAVGEAARYEAIRQIEQLGATNIIIRSVKPIDKKDKSESETVEYGLTRNDL